MCFRQRVSAGLAVARALSRPSQVPRDRQLQPPLHHRHPSTAISRLTARTCIHIIASASPPRQSYFCAYPLICASTAGRRRCVAAYHTSRPHNHATTSLFRNTFRSRIILFNCAVPLLRNCRKYLRPHTPTSGQSARSLHSGPTLLEFPHSQAQHLAVFRFGSRCRHFGAKEITRFSG